MNRDFVREGLVMIEEETRRQGFIQNAAGFPYGWNIPPNYALAT